MSRELGWKSIFNRTKAEKSKATATSDWEKRFPPSFFTKSQTTQIVNTPMSAGKKRTQNSELPNPWIKTEIQDVTGGTDK
jgi:hypothetical protein